MSIFYRNSNHHWKCREQKQNFQRILVIVFWNFTIFEYKPDQPKVKQNVISSKRNLVYEVRHETPNDFAIRLLRKKEILGKSSIWVETQSHAQPPLPKFNFGSSSQKSCKGRYQTFIVLSRFTGLLNFVPNILPRIV